MSLSDWIDTMSCLVSKYDQGLLIVVNLYVDPSWLTPVLK